MFKPEDLGSERPRTGHGPAAGAMFGTHSAPPLMPTQPRFVACSSAILNLSRYRRPWEREDEGAESKVLKPHLSTSDFVRFLSCLLICT
jgi:hypothetical protein